MSETIERHVQYHPWVARGPRQRRPHDYWSRRSRPPTPVGPAFVAPADTRPDPDGPDQETTT